MAVLLPLGMTLFAVNMMALFPAAFLPEMGGDLRVSASAMGQALTVTALGQMLTAVPLTAATAGWHRKRLLLAAMAVLVVANIGTALSSDYSLTMAARFVLGGASGLAWALLAEYARHVAPAHSRGKAIAIVMAGMPLSTLGVPAGALLGEALGWRAAFLAMSALAAALTVWIAAVAPRYPGRRREHRTPMRRALRIPGVVPVLLVTLVFLLAQTILYFYIGTFLPRVRMAGHTGLVLLVFGGMSLPGIWIVVACIKRRLRILTTASVLLVATAAAILAVIDNSPVLVYTAVTVWGLGWGGAPMLLQAALADAGGDQANAAQAMFVTVWSIATITAGATGGILLDTLGATSIPYSVLFLTTLALILVLICQSGSSNLVGVRRGRPDVRSPSVTGLWCGCPDERSP